MDGDYSIVTGKRRTLTWPDYVLFVLTLVASSGIGFYYAIKDRKKNSTAEFLLGGRGMHTIPVAMSLVVTFLSAMTLLGMPAEVYNYDTMFGWLALGMVLAVAASAHVFHPVFYNLGVTSVYEYLEMRFGRATRIVACADWIFQTLAYLAFVLYSPSLALNAVTGFSLSGSMVAVGVVVTLYTSMGGMKAVLWTDSLQSTLIAMGLIAVLVQGSIVTGGFGNAWRIAEERSRIHFTDFDFDPGKRHSIWSVVIGGGLMWMSYYGVNQCQVQRVLSCPSLKNAKVALWISAFGLVFIVTMCTLIGVVLFAFYSDCHPIRFNNLISGTDQLLPLFVMDILGDKTGLPGIFISCVISGSLSSLSSGLNALSAVTLQDFIRPYCCGKITELKSTVISKLLVALYGLLILALAFVASTMGNALQICYTVLSVLDGPMFGIFVLGIFLPWANKWGSVFGYLISQILLGWIGFGAYFFVSPAPESKSYIHGCNWNITDVGNMTYRNGSATTHTMYLVEMNITTAEISKSDDTYFAIYKLSYLYYTALGMTITVVTGLIISFITGPTKPKFIDPRLICPIFDILLPCLPEKVKNRLHFGVRYSEIPKNAKATDEDYTFSDSKSPDGHDDNVGARDKLQPDHHVGEDSI